MENQEWINKFDKVWRANRKTKKLEVLSPKGIRCINPNPGGGEP